MSLFCITLFINLANDDDDDDDAKNDLFEPHTGSTTATKHNKELHHSLTLKCILHVNYYYVALFALHGALYGHTLALIILIIRKIFWFLLFGSKKNVTVCN